MEHNASPARQASRRFVACVVGLLAMVAATNGVVDPYGLYGSGLFRPVTFGSHRESARLLAELTPPPRVLVLGSSRVGKVEPAYLEARLGEPAFNANLNAATAETLLAYVRYALAVLPRPPQMLILGLDSLSFSDVSAIDEQLVNTRVLARQVPELVGVRQRVAVWLRLVDQFQLEDSLWSLRMAASGGYPEPTFRFAPDGRRVWRDESPAATGPAILERVLPELVHVHVGYYEAFDALSPARLAAFDTIVEICAAAGIELIVYATPLQPALRDALMAQPNYAARQRELIEYLDRASRSHGFAFVDLSDIGLFNGDPDDWLDPLHHGEATGRLIVDRLLASRRVAHAVQ